MKRRRLKIGKEEGCSKQERYLYALAAFCLSTAFQKFPPASGDPYCGDIDFGLYDTARTACLRSCARKKFTVPIQVYRPCSGQKKSPPRDRLWGGCFKFYLSDTSLADFSLLAISPADFSKSNTSGIRLDAVRVPMQWLLPSSTQ